MTDTDLRLIHSKLNSLSERLDKLEVQFNLIRQLIEKDVVISPVPSRPADLTKATQSYGALGEIPCVFDNIRGEDRLKPVGISCPCPRCSPYALSLGSFTDAGLKQEWGNEDVD